jgi:gamma-glutamyltranspeptidase / glutathione hydrolase
MIIDPFSSFSRPAVGGRRGAVAAAHPLATAAGQLILAQGGSAIDAVIAAQAMLAVVAPDACGLGGDGLMLVQSAGQSPVAVNGAGAAPAGAKDVTATGGASVAVPGLVDGWVALQSRWGRMDLSTTLAPAIEAAQAGVTVPAALEKARREQAQRLAAGGASGWELLQCAEGDLFRQPALAETLAGVARNGRDAFYRGALAEAISAAVRRCGGALMPSDLAPDAAVVAPPISFTFGRAVVHVQPPASQGLLLAMALRGWLQLAPNADAARAHLGVELTQAAFSLRDEVGRGVVIMDEMPRIDPERAARRGGPRAYLHTAGVAAADQDGLVVASLVSVFDDFGSAVFVPEGGFTLNNRAGGFTQGANAFAPGKRPIHTLAPVIVELDDGVVALSTPGADGQVQTLLQVILDWLVAGTPLPQAIAAPRWRSENNRLLVEADHPARDDLAARGHDVVDVAAGDMRFGSITAAGMSRGRPFALADWRRMAWAGVA